MSRNKSKLKICRKCGKKVDSYSYGFYCEVCAEEVWDQGFNSTSQHAEEIYENNLEQVRKINAFLNDVDPSFEELLELVNYKSGIFYCKTWHLRQLRWHHFGDKRNEELLQNLLHEPCRKCSSKGKLKFDTKWN